MEFIGFAFNDFNLVVYPFQLAGGESFSWQIKRISFEDTGCPFSFKVLPILPYFATTKLRMIIA